MRALESGDRSKKSSKGVTKPNVWPTLEDKTSQYAYLPLEGPVPADGVGPEKKVH